MSKNIVICFDGTWQTSDSKSQTNVVETAKLVWPRDEGKVEQIVYYDAGVGSGDVTVCKRIDSLLGGAFGVGLLSNIETAYRFLTFNYVPGDKLFVFGFSRGAFSARSLCGLIFNCGILKKTDVGEVREAIGIYKSRAPKHLPWAEEAKAFRDRTGAPGCCVEDDLARRGMSGEQVAPITVTYLGIWDTVGAMGVPKHIFFADWFNKSLQFHDPSLSPMVKSARHALAIDETRRIFDATPWDNLDKLNEDALKKNLAPEQWPYQQQWFPGDHGSVGGGGENLGITKATLVWILEGARLAGLAVDDDALNKARDEAKDAHKESLDCMKVRPFSVTSSLATRAPRAWPKTEKVYAISEVALKRYAEAPENLPERQAYRPLTLQSIAEKLSEMASR